MGSFAGRRAGRGESVTTEEAQLKGEELVRRYFAGATVRWCETNQVKPPYPFVALKLTDVSHFLHPDESGETEISQRYYCTGRVVLNLYTSGRKGVGKPGMSAPPPRNTAVSDLQRFIRYLGSDAGQDFLEEHDICLQEEGSTVDVSALLNDAKYAGVFHQFCGRCVWTFQYNTTGRAGQHCTDTERGRHQRASC